MLQAAIFDMGGVLVHFSHDRMCQQVGQLCGRSGDDLRRLLLDSGLQWEFERGLLSAEEFHDRIQQTVGRNIPFDALIDAASDIFELNRPIVPILDELRRRKLRLVLLSNTSIWHYQFICKRYDLLDRFDATILSYEVNAIKPEAEIYEAALVAIHCPPQNCFYTDDIPRYVEAGRKFGLDAEVFIDTNRLERQLRARGISFD